MVGLAVGSKVCSKNHQWGLPIMTKAAMPEPFTYPPDDWVKGFFDEPNECGFYSFYGDFGNIAYRVQRAAQFNHLITTDQAEAYANARVREALEEAANIAGSAFRRSRAAYCSGGEPYAQGAADCAGFIETDIRVLISKQ
jgi:hypothetical protein